jgi:hypothetical protein
VFQNVFLKVSREVLLYSQENLGQSVTLNRLGSVIFCEVSKCVGGDLKKKKDEVLTWVGEKKITSNI